MGYNRKDEVLDLWHILKSRNNTFAMWAASESLTTVSEFRIKAAELVTQGYYISEEMMKEAVRHFYTVTVIPFEDPQQDDNIRAVVTEKKIKPLPQQRKKQQQQQQSGSQEIAASVVSQEGQTVSNSVGTTTPPQQLSVSDQLGDLENNHENKDSESQLPRVG